MKRCDALYKILNFGRKEEKNFLKEGKTHEAYQIESARNQLIYSLALGTIKDVVRLLEDMTEHFRDENNVLHCAWDYVSDNFTRRLVVDLKKEFGIKHLSNEAEEEETEYIVPSEDLEKAVTRIWKVYGADGHRQRESFSPSEKYNFSNKEKGVRILEVFNSDKTNTNEFSVVKITRDTAEKCEKEFWGQLYDGIFENSRTGEIVEITEADLCSILEKQ